MGAAGSVLEQEASKPLDASDIKNGEEGALEEVVRLRLLLKQHYEATPQPQMTEGTEKKADDPGGVSMQAPTPKKPGPPTPKRPDTEPPKKGRARSAR